MNKIDQMQSAGRTNTGYEFLAAPEGLAEALKAIGWDASRSVDGLEAYVIAQDNQWVEKFRGTHDECFKQLLRLQSQSVDWALEHGGWYIIPAQPWDEAIAARDHLAEADSGAAPRG